MCEVSICYHRDFRFVYKSCIERNMFQNIIGTSHTVLGNIQYIYITYTHLRKDEDEYHADKEARLLRRAPDARVAHYPDGVAGGQAGQAHGEAGPEVQEALEGVSAGCGHRGIHVF